MANENRRKLYNAMQQAGYDIGSYDDFDRRMNNPQDRVKFYDAVQEAGYDIGGFGDFENRIKGSKYKLSANGREFQVSEREYKDFIARRNGTQPQATPQPTPQPQKPTTLSPEERQAMARQTQGLVDASGRNVARGKAYLQGLMQKPTFDTEPVRVGAKTNPNVVKQSSFNPETAEMEDTYLTQAGEFESEAMADFAQDEVDAAKKTNIERIDEQIAKLEAEKQRRSGAGGLPKGWGTAMYQSGMGVPQDNREDNDIDIALRDLRQAKTMYERNKQLHDSSNFLGGVGLPLTKDFFNNWKNFSFGVWDTLHDVGLYDFGVSDMAKAGAYNRIKNKLEKGEELSDHETDIAVAGMLLSAAQSETDLPLAYKTGEITANMAPFMAQMAANPASGLGKGLARKAVRKFGRDGIGAVAARVSARIGGNLAEAAVLSNTLQAGNVAADAMRRATGDTFINDENGEIKLGHYEKDDEGNPVFVEGGEDMALYKAEVSSLIENFTELGAGGSINKLLGKAATSNIGTRLGLSRINDFVKRMGTTDFAKATRRFMEKTHWDGMIEEPLEEEYGIILNSLLVGDNKLSDLFDSEQQAEIFAGTMWFGGFMAAMNTAAYPISKRRMKNNLSKADTRGQFELGEDWESWKERIDNMGDSEVKGLLYGIREDEQLTEAQKNAIFDYTIRLKQYQGSNVAGMLMRIENNVPQDDAVIEDAYEQGASIDEPADKNKAKELYDLRLQTATEVLGESTVEMLDDNPIPTLLRLRERGEEAEINAALDYVNAKYAYDGMIDRVQDDIDVAQQQADYMIRRRTNFTTLGEPTIIPVITQQGKRMYITDGEVSALEDGSIDLTNSNDDLIAVDEEGNVTFLSAKDIKTVEEQINPAQALEETRNNIAQELSKKEADEIDGVLPFLSNDVYQGADEQGTPLQITILQDNGDGNVIANVTGLGEGVTLPKQTIQSWVDGLRMANLQQEEAERLAQYEPAEEYDYEPTQDIEGYEPVEDYSEYGENGNDGNEYEQPFDGVTQAEAQAEAEQYQANRPAMEKIPVLQDAEGKPILNKKGRPQYQWTQAPVETTADALSDLNDGILVDARDTAQNMRKQADERLQKVKAQKVKGDDPIEEAESRKQIRNQIQAAQSEVDYWKNVTQEINKRMSAESARIQAEIETKKTQEQREAEEAERKRIAAELDAKEREAIRKEIEKDSKKRNEPYKPLTEAKKEMADDDEAMAILNDTEPRDLAEWVSSLIKPHSMLWQDENGQRGLQSELGPNRSDIQKFISLLAQRDNGGKPFAEVVDEIYSELPDAMKTQYTDQDVRNTLLDLFNEGSVQRMRNLAEEHRIEEAKAQYEYNRRREEEAELQAWADAFHLSPEERESFEAWMEEDTPIELSDEELAHIINIIDEQENEQSGGSQEVGNEPDTTAEEGGNTELPSEQQRTNATQEPEQGSEDNAVEGENEPANVEQEPTATSGNGYTITPTKYTTKRGKELDMQLITFDNDLTKEQKRAADKFARDKKGWYDRNKNGYMMRSEADAEELAKLLGSEKAVQEAQPISLADIQSVTDEAESKPQEQPEATTETTEQPQTSANETAKKMYKEVSKLMQEKLLMPNGLANVHFDTIELHPFVNDRDVTEEHRNDVHSFDGIHRNRDGSLQLNEGNVVLASVSGLAPEEQIIVLQKALDKLKGEQQETANETPQQEQQKEQPKEQQKPPKSKYVSDEDAERFAQLKERLRQKLLGQMNMGIDPEIFTLGVEMTYMIVKNQARKFADYAKAMIEEMGDAIRPYLKAFYNGARELPELEDIADELTPYEEVRTFDVTNFDKEGAKDLIKTAEVVAKEDEANNQAETVKEAIKEDVNDKDRNDEPSNTRPATQEDLEKAPRVWYNGKRYGIIALMHEGQQVNAIQFEKPRIIRVVLSNGQSVEPDQLRVDIEKPQEETAIEKPNVKNGEKPNKKGEKPLKPTKNNVSSQSGQLDLFGNTNLNDTNNDTGEIGKPENGSRGNGTVGNIPTDGNGVLDTVGTGGTNGEETASVPNKTSGVADGTGNAVPSERGEGSVTGGNNATSEAGQPLPDGRPSVRTGEDENGGSSATTNPEKGEGVSKPIKKPTNVKDFKDFLRSQLTFTNNYLYPENASEIDNMTPLQRLRANVDALEVLRTLMRDGRTSTEEERNILGRYRGWGGIDLSKAYSTQSIRSNYTDRWGPQGERSKLYSRLADVLDELDPDGERKILTAMRRATLTSYYTPTSIARVMNHFIALAGFKYGNMLDPSMGNGVFEGTMPKDIQQRTMIHGVELDWLTGQIARNLYPDANISITGYEESNKPDNAFDIVISNIPFGDISVTDKTWKHDSTPIRRAAQNKIHNYFTVKMIDNTRPGGLCVIMTSNAILDTKGNQIIRDYIADKTEVLGVVRLPDNTFKGAGTSVVTDVIFLRKYKDDRDKSNTRNNETYLNDIEKPFLSSEKLSLTNPTDNKTYEVSVNGYFAANKEMMIGETKAGGQYRADEFGLTSKMETDEIASAMKKKVERIVGSRKGSLFDTHKTAREVKEAVSEAYKGDGTYISSGNIVEQNGMFGIVTTERSKYGEINATFNEMPSLESKADRIRAMLPIRKAMKELISREIDGESESTLIELRKNLRSAYDKFFKKFGRLNDKENDFLTEDIDGYSLRSLEQMKGGKFDRLSDIFTKSTIKPKLNLSTAKTPQEAISLSLAEYGEINPSFMSGILGDSWVEQCGGILYKIPFTEDSFETADAYLSGDVKTKLEQAREAAKQDNSFDVNVKALEEAQPKDIPFDEINIRMGARWIPSEVYTDFLYETFGISKYSSRKNRSGIVYMPEVDQFTVNINASELGGEADVWRTSRRSASEVFAAALQDKTLTVYDTIREFGAERKVINKEETELVNSKVQDLRSYFEDWIGRDAKREEMLSRLYNDKFNRVVLRKFDGSHINVAGLMGKELRPHQKDAIWMLINNRGGIVDHIVGAGKTLVMQSAIMEMRRMGIAKKPMIIGLKATVAQIAKEFRESFPAARVLAPTEKDFAKANRKKLISQIALNDYDCIVLSHDQYNALPHAEWVERMVIDEQIAQLDAAIEYLYGSDDMSQLTKKQIKGLEKRKANLEARLRSLLDRKVDREFTFEGLGVDYLFVDECQLYKSLPYVTTYDRVAGLGNKEGSQRAIALLNGVRYLQSMHQGDRGVVFLSGTTISNSLSEVYHLLNYLRPSEMKRLGFFTFDAWAGTFAEHTAELEYGVTNELKEKDRFRNFTNVQELSKMYAEITDVRNDMNLKLPKPNMRSHIVPVPQSDAMMEINRQIINMVRMRDGSYFGKESKDTTPWGLLASDLSAKAAINPRLIDDKLDGEGGKIPYCCDKVKEIYDKFNEQKGTQLIFCDQGVPGRGKAYDAYSDIINRLVNDYGIPREEIVDIHVADTDEKRKALFAKVNEGKVRILIGGTRNMGTGVNVQKRIVAMHHVDVPWTPADREQREGRGVRQGNEVARDFNDNNVDVYFYATEGSLDMYKYQLQETKGKMFAQFKSGTIGERTFDEGDAEGDFDPAEIVATLSGNPVIFEKSKQDKKVEKLRRAKRAYESDWNRRNERFQALKQQKRNFERLIEKNAMDIKSLERNGFVANEEGKYPTTLTVSIKDNYSSRKTFDKPKEAGKYIHDLLREGKKVQLSGFGQEANIITLITEAGFFGKPVAELNNFGGIKYTVEISDDDTAAGVAFRNLLQKVYSNKRVYANGLETINSQLKSADPGKKEFPKQAELDEAIKRQKQLDAEYKKLAEDEEGHTTTRFRIDDTLPFYSNAARAVEQVKQDKATPEQWLKMIEKNGGLKSGEDKWIGLSDWLKASKAKSLTKQEVMDYIRENQIQIEETEYDNRDHNWSVVSLFTDEWEGYQAEAYDNNPEIEPDEQVSYAWRKMCDKYGASGLHGFNNAFRYDEYGQLEVDDYDEAVRLAKEYKGVDLPNEINDTRLSYTTQGLDNKREIALTVPTIESWNTQDEVHFGDAGQGRAVAWVRFGETTIDVDNTKQKEAYNEVSRKFNEYADKIRDKYGSLQTFLYGMPNERGTEEEINEYNKRYDAISKAQDETLKSAKQRVLVIDEIQSKRHQEGREKGYKGSKEDFDRLVNARSTARIAKGTKENYEKALKDKYNTWAFGPSLTEEEKVHWETLKKTSKEAKQREEEAEQKYNLDGIPSAPFEKNWHELAMKRMLRYAAENGYDKVAWTTGEQQAERYNIGNIVSGIDAIPFKAGVEDGIDYDGTQILIYTNNETLDLDVDSNGVIVKGHEQASYEYEGKNLSDVVGKEVAQKLLTGKEEKLRGNDFRIGGEGMKGFYDEILPRFMNKYGKKWGAKVGTVELPNVEESAQTMWAVDVTPEMKDSVMQGQPMFRQTQQATAQRTTMQAIREAINDIIDKLHIADRVTILETTEGLKGKKARAKGWFDVKTGKIVVVLPNNRNAADAMRTILHEAVAHMGLRELFGKEFNNFLMDVYSNASESIRRKINANAAKKGWDIREATEEYLASLAETQNFEEAKKQGIWNKVKEWFNAMLSKVGIPKLFTTSYDDNELRYILWRSWRNLTENGNRDYLGMAEDIVKRDDLGVGEFARENNELSDIERKAKADGTWMKAPNGKPTNLTERQWLQVRTKAFKKWFGDWENNPEQASKILDENGEPRVVYHSTDSDFTIFDNKEKGRNTDGNADSIASATTAHLGFWFADEKEVWRDKHVPCFLSIKEPSEYNTLMDLIGSIDTYVSEKDMEDDSYDDIASEYKGDLLSENDGVIIQKDHEHQNKQTYVVFSPNQIKSATDNNGEFDDENEDIRFREDEENEINFNSETTDIWNDRRLSMTERITAAATRLAANQQDNKMLRNDAVRAIGNNLSELNKAMSLQRKFDIATAKRIADLARVLMDGGYLKDIRQQEVKRLLAAVKNSVGHNDIENDVQKIMDILVDNQLRNAEATLHELETIKGSKVNASGVEVIGQLDPDGAHIMKAFKKYRDFSKEDIEDAIANAEERMTSSDNAVADEAALDYVALQFAQEYAQNIKDSKTDEKLLRDEIKQTHDDASERERLTDAYRETIKSLQDAIRQTKIERVQAYNELVARLTNSLRGSIENAKAFKEAEQRRISEIHHNANSDMEGRPSNEHYKPKFKDKFVNNSLVQFLFQPLMTFEQMLRVFGSKSANGEGYLYNRFMRGWVDARQKEIKGVRSKYATLDAKAREIFGRKVKDWGDLIRYVGKLPRAEVTFWDGGEMRAHELTQGNLMYIYMVNKMLDGKMKLRKMGISEETVAEIEEMLDPRLKSLADWIQEDFLVKTRNEYNKTHKRMFGASMAAIENYFPLKILSNARVDNPEDLDNPDFGDTISTTTGSIIKRRRNTLALDITGADALNVILDHVAQMEHWNAFAEFKRDLNTLRTYKRFRNQVYNMNTIYGSGKKLWTKFNDVCRMAAGVYRPPRATLDEAAVNFAKGVTAAKVSFRVFTALKQFLSFPAYLPEARFDILMKNLANPAKAWKWGMENLPIFNERWKSRIAGDPRLMKTDMDWKMWRTQVLQLASRWGMKPNAFVDALTVSMGAHAIYETKKKRYLKEGYSDEQAERKAIQDAEIAYNLTQQSSESAFTSTMQVDRSWLSVLLTVFRNSPMSYQRQLHNALRNFKHNMNLANYDARIEYMKKQYVRDGLDEETAEYNAENKYTRQLLKDWVTVATFGYILQLAWNMGAYLPYLLFGGDDDEKDKMLDDVAAHTTFGSLEGLTGGDILSQAGGMLLNGEGNPAYLNKDMPLTSDISAMLKKVGNGESAEAINDIIQLAVQSGIGVNPQSITDGVLGIMDVCGDDPALAHEAMICVWRILQVPQSQIDKLYFDEVGLSGEEVSNYTPQQLAQRYAQFKVKRGRLLAPWAWNDREKERKLIDKANKTIKERVQHGNDGEISEAFERAKEIYDEVKPTMSKANKAMQKSYIDSARVISSVPDEKVAVYNLYKKADENLDKLAKGYLNSNTHAQAELYRKAILDYRAAMADAMNAPDKVKRERAIKNITAVMDDFKKKKKELNAEY